MYCLYIYIKIDYLKPLIIDDDTLLKLKRIYNIDNNNSFNYQVVQSK